MIRGLLFDLDDTLADLAGTERLVFERVGELVAQRITAVDLGAFRERYAALADDHYDSFLRGEVDFHGYRRNRLSDALSPWGALDEELFVAYTVEKRRVVEELTAFADAAGTVREARSRGIRVGVLTNGPSGMQRRKLGVIGLAGDFDAVAISEEIGYSKPDAEAFHLAADMLGLVPEEVAMVGDSLEKDVLGALSAGLAASVWIRRRRGSAPEGALVVDELSEVFAALVL